MISHITFAIVLVMVNQAKATRWPSELLSFPALTAADEITVRTLLSAMRALPLSEGVEDEAIRIRRLRRVKLPDALILGTARAHGLKLLTLDRHLSGLSADP